MGIGVSVFLIALGGILAFAVNVATEGINLNAVGVILMVVGSVGLVLSFLFRDSMYWPWGGSGRTVIREREYRDGRVDRPVRRVREVVEHREEPY